MRSLHQIVSDNVKAVAAGTLPPTGLYLGEAPDPGHPWSVVLSIVNNSTEYTVVNNATGEEGITTTDTTEAHAIARAKNLSEAS